MKREVTAILFVGGAIGISWVLWITAVPHREQPTSEVNSAATELRNDALDSDFSEQLLGALVKKGDENRRDAVRAGFAEATGDILVIQDADLTAPPEDLPKFFHAIVEGLAEFGNGSRLVYPMEGKAMRFLNLIGNKGFALTLSWVLGQPVKDSLCGTKMLFRDDYEELILLVHERLGDFDPFGDFNLLFGSAMMGLRIRDIPVRYRDRVYGETNISRFRHGFILLKMTGLALRRIHFFPY